MEKQMFKKIFVVLAVVSISVYAQKLPLTILHWNDFHSQNVPFTLKAKSIITGNDTSYQVGGSATLKAYIEKYKILSSNTIVLNAGDDFQGSPVSSITQGKSQIQIMNLIAPEAMTIGNHEFDYGRQSLDEKFHEAAFPIISANLVDKITHNTFVQPYIIKSVNGVTVAVIGLMTPELSTLTLPENITNLYVESPYSTIKKLIPEMKKKGANIIVVLSHMGVDEDSILATKIPDIDVIIGGHSHTSLFKPKHVNGILICQAGTRGRYLGKLDLIIDVAKDTILSGDGELIECRTADIVPDSNVTKKVTEFENLVGEKMKEVIGELKNDWKRQNNAESNIGNWISDAIRDYAAVDIAIQNNGGIRKDLLAGPVTVRDLWEISPFGNLLLKITVTGETLIKMIEHQPALRDDFCNFSGLSYSYSGNDKSFKLESITVNGKPVNPKKLYIFVTNNYVQQQSQKYFGVSFPNESIHSLNISDRDVLIEAVRKQKVIDSRIEGRILEVKK